MEKSQIVRAGLFGALLAYGASACAVTLAITEFAAFLAAPELDPDPADPSFNSIQETGIGFGFNEFEAVGLGVEFLNALDADGLGEVSYAVSNQTGAALGTFWFFGYLDAEVGVPFFNEFGELVSVDGTGPGDPEPDSWEIAEPYAAGGLLDSLLAGTLSDSNGVPVGSEDDVGLALGFQIAGLGVGETLNASFQISDTDIGGLRQVSASNGEGFYLNGSVSISPADAPAPSALWLLLFAPLARLFSRRAPRPVTAGR